MGSFPSVDPGTTPIGSIHGVNMGGHAPLVGSHVYLLEAGNTGYGSVAKSLISSSASGATANGSWNNSGYTTDLFVPSVDAAGNPFYGMTTDSGGGFTLTGDYTCDVGRVVYLVGVGGNPGLSGSAVTVTQAQVTSLSGSGTTETATVTLTFSSSPGYSAGSNLSFSGFSGSFQSGTGINGTSSVVTSASGATASVSIPDPGGAVAVGTYSVAGMATPSYFNHAAVNIAVLGKCPASGNFASSIPFIFINEVSTVAAAYALQPYVATSGTNQSGIDQFHIGSTSTALGLQGIQNAAANAANLYDITGTNALTAATHDALSVLPTNSSGTVPQAELDTLANVLASCVDSGNSYRAGIGTLQASCQTLFQHASSNGVYDTSAGNSWTLSTSTDAFNTFQAAVNIARFPQGAGVGSTSSGTQTITTAFSSTTASSFTNGLYALETGTVPFAPNLHSTNAGAPNNFTVPITITGNGLNEPQLMALDANGNAWVANYGGNSISYFAANGSAIYNETGNGLNGPYGVAVDLTGDVWVGSYNGTRASYTMSTFSVASTPTALDNAAVSAFYDPPYGIAINGLNTVWVGEQGTNLATFTSATNIAGNKVNEEAPTLNDDYELAFDGTGRPIVLVGDATSTSTNVIYCPGCAPTTGGDLGDYAITGMGDPSGIAVDSNGNAFFASISNSSLAKINPANGGTTSFTVSGNGLNNPYAIAIDGLGNVWVTNNGGNSISKFSNGGTALGNLTGNGLSLPEAVVIGGDGSVWVTSFATNSITEYVGAAAPVITPLCAGLPSTANNSGASNLGTRP